MAARAWESELIQTYFIAARDRIKIGKSSQVDVRFKTFATVSAEPLKILLVLDGDHEQDLHQRFHADHIRGEWFMLSQAIKDFIKNPVVIPKPQLPLPPRRRMTRLEFERKDRKLSQRVLASLCHLHQPILSQIERGIRTPTTEQLQHLSEVLHVQASELLKDVVIK